MSQANPAATREIDGHTYSVYMLDPDTAIDVSADLQRWLLPALGELVGLATDERDTLVQKAISAAVQKFVAGADATTVKRLVRTMMRVTFCPGVGKLGDSDAWKLHFHGRYWPMMKVAAFAVEVNFLDFFAGWAAIRTSVAARLSSLGVAGAGASESPQAPAGTSSGS